MTTPDGSGPKDLNDLTINRPDHAPQLEEMREIKNPKTGTMNKVPNMESERYRAIMRHQAGAVTVVATGDPGARAGLTATAVASVSDKPPALLVCVGRETQAHGLIGQMRVFSVNLLSSEQQAVADLFAGRDGVSGENRFRGSDWRVGAAGAPILDGALATLECRLTDQHAFSTHTIFIGQVIDGLFRAEVSPLLYFRGDYWDVGAR
ncbi:MAG: flavin reductase family protein [Pseudomonadota bacterium]